jgi:predicted nucleic acid-binding protein
VGAVSTPALSDGERIVLDTVALVYFVEQHPEYGPVARSIMERVQDGRLEAIVSSIALAELLVFPYRQNQPQVAHTLRIGLERFPNLTMVDVDADIADEASRIRAKHNLRIPDAVHVATGLSREVDWIVTNDYSLRRVASEGIRVWLFNEHLQGLQGTS